MRAIDHQGLCQFAPKGLGWQDLTGGALDVTTYLIHTASEFFLLFNTCSYIDPLCVASFSPQVLDWPDLWRVY